MVGLKHAPSELSSGVLQSACWTNLYSWVKIKSSSWWLARLLHRVKAYFTIRCRLQSWNKLNAFFLFTLCCGASYLPIGLHCTYHMTFFCKRYIHERASTVTLAVKNTSDNPGDVDSIPGLGWSPGGGHGNPLQYFCLENPMDRGAWQTTVHRVTRSQPWQAT